MNSGDDLSIPGGYVPMAPSRKLRQIFDIMTLWTILCAIVLIMGTVAQSDDELSEDSSYVALCNSTFPEANGVSYIQQS
jgi:hypothetical protein